MGMERFDRTVAGLTVVAWAVAYGAFLYSPPQRSNTDTSDALAIAFAAAIAMTFVSLCVSLANWLRNRE
jgi:hypothetical protein